jgi:hypothetical protein
LVKFKPIPKPAKFMKWNCPTLKHGTIHSNLNGFQSQRSENTKIERIELGQIAQKCRLAWLYTGYKVNHLSSSR